MPPLQVENDEDEWWLRHTLLINELSELAFVQTVGGRSQPNSWRLQNNNDRRNEDEMRLLMLCLVCTIVICGTDVFKKKLQLVVVSIYTPTVRWNFLRSLQIPFRHLSSFF